MQLPGADGTPAKDDFIGLALHECAVANIVWSTIYAYDASVLTDKQPTSMADFFDLEAFPGAVIRERPDRLGERRRRHDEPDRFRLLLGGGVVVVPGQRVHLVGQGVGAAGLDFGEVDVARIERY